MAKKINAPTAGGKDMHPAESHSLKKARVPGAKNKSIKVPKAK